MGNWVIDMMYIHISQAKHLKGGVKILENTLYQDLFIFSSSGMMAVTLFLIPNPIGLQKER